MTEDEALAKAWDQGYRAALLDTIAAVADGHSPADVLAAFDASDPGVGV